MPRLSVFPKGFIFALVERRMTLEEWIEHAATLDVEGLELAPNFFDDFDAASIARVRKAIEARGLVVSMLCHSPDFTRPDPQDRAAEVARTADMFRVTVALGARHCRVLSGQNRPGLEESEALAWVVDCLRQLEPHARRAGVVMCLENHYKDSLWDYPEFAQSRARYLALLEAVDSPWLGAQFDPSNAIVAGEDPQALLDRVLPRLVTMHASDRYLEGGSVEDLRRMARDPQHGYAPFLRHGVIGCGLNDYDRIFGTLARAGFDGWISIEDGEGPTVATGLENLRRSARFLRACIARHWR